MPFDKNLPSAKDDRIILRSQIITQPQFDSDRGIGVEYVDPGYGTVKIEDVLTKEVGYMNATPRKSFTSFETFKYASVLIIKAVPGIGDIYRRGEEIYNALKAVYTDLSNIDPYKRVEVETKYTYRDFYHDLYVWDYSKTWKYIGYSLSRYYYRIYGMWYFDSKIGEFRYNVEYYTHQNGYPPEVIAKAPNYMKYNVLSQLAYEAWKMGRTYYETY
ncbi:hypothetical protein ATZ99_00790 [Thermovenabulum gondwanense]|uniref:Uncharacterized protein n=1 Tax=Thermovenabulum gondwanense TaxID=520767 RepID=A0A161PW41_9FIRM|nr:hypothetical protein ATZ99_00790 [Thermovenabulum gondwanense]